jgi:hypothetical protein
VKKRMARYSLGRSGWHRFWFLVLAIVASVCLVTAVTPTAEERYAALAKERAECKERCRPKAGDITHREQTIAEKMINPKAAYTGFAECICS